jgi:hypothetical protein
MQNTFNFYYYCANFVNVTAFIVHGGGQGFVHPPMGAGVQCVLGR